MAMELIQKRNFTLATGDSKPNRLRRLKIGISHGSVVAPSFSISTFSTWPPPAITKKFSYAGDTPLICRIEKVVNDSCPGVDYFFRVSPDQRLKLNHAKTVTAVFHLYNQETKRELKIYNTKKILLFCTVPTYHGVKLYRTLRYRLYLKAFRKKLSACLSYC